MLKRIALSAALIALASQPLAAQDLPVCPKGTIGQWEWNATAERTRIYYSKGTWNLGPDAGQQQALKPKIELTRIAGTGKPDQAYLNIIQFPIGVSVPIKGEDHPLFGEKPHAYRVGIAPQSGNLALEVTNTWRSLSRLSLGLFGGSTTIPGADSAGTLAKLVKGKGVLGLFLFPSFDEGFDKEPVAMLVMPEDGRNAAWQAAATAHQALAAKVAEGPGCKTR